jgi:uncharacterized protein with GYD domain
MTHTGGAEHRRRRQIAPSLKEVPNMATFITTLKFTQQGIQTIGDTTRRAAGFKSSAKKLGIKVTDMYWTLGDCDGVIIFQAPDDETATAALLHLGALGNVQTTTCRAFTASEMDKLLSRNKAG